MNVDGVALELAGYSAQKLTQTRITMFNIKLDYCVIHVSDWERSNTFYRDVLGAELVPVGTE